MKESRATRLDAAAPQPETEDLLLAWRRSGWRPQIIAPPGQAYVVLPTLRVP